MTQAKLKEPNILLAGSNCRRLVKNVSHLLNSAAIQRLEAEIHRNAKLLFELGESHFVFAKSLPAKNWRQRASRFYYGAYNMKRAVSLYVSGEFSTDSNDHKTISDLPDKFPDANTYSTQLRSLRDDRNIADYSHVSSDADLLLSTLDAEALVEKFRDDARAYLKGRGCVV